MCPKKSMTATREVVEFYYIKSYQGEVSVDIGVEDAVSGEPYLGSLIRQLLSAILCCS